MLEISTASWTLFDSARVQREELLGEPVERLAQVLPHGSADLVRVPHHLLERAVLRHPLRRSAFTEKRWKEIYTFALENEFRFLSYGDSSLLLK